MSINGRECLKFGIITFLKKEENKVQCVYCKVDLAYHSSTTSMIQHLNRKHPLHAVSPSVAETSTSQRSMDSFVRPAQSCTVQEAAIFTESILNMLVTDMRPLSMVEDKGFRDMISTFNPKYNLPSRTYFTQLMEKKHRDITEKLKRQLSMTMGPMWWQQQEFLERGMGGLLCLVEHFKKSELACTKLKEKQQQMGKPPLMLIQDVSTRWNSTYHMLSRLLEQRWPVTAALSDPAVNPRGKHHYLDLKPEQWHISEELTQVLGPFEGATGVLSGEQYVTLSALPQLVQNLKKSTLTAEPESAPVKAFQASAAEQITERWQGLYSDSMMPFGFPGMTRVIYFYGRAYLEFLRKSALWLSNGEAFTTDNRTVQL
ncbi:Zinc finger BED domain-containing protein 1 [Anabarilius grahami]|uniref:Zinc finger BED domain-containing protein 1 n=1 Tax=Anabarilius grahami TaxID=495550 RepID=A0A3N0XM84_ANAGA|nr:Zinc finger BED domain-containing protein 1 [Anabarilius grahami]